MCNANFAMPKDYRPHIKRLVREGWEVSRADKHGRLTHPVYGTVHFSISPSDSHSLKNFLADIRRRIKQHDSTQ